MAESHKRIQRKPKFKVGQVVGVKGRALLGEVLEVLPNRPPCKPSAPHCYFVTGCISAQTENDLRALTKREKGEKS